MSSRLHGSIASENSLIGNLPSEWDVSGIGDPSIQGFATDFSVNRGTTVEFKINTTASAYHIDIYRIGYYGGRGARKVVTINPSTSLPQTQPAFVSDPVTGLVDCGNWAVSASWAVPADATSGVYIARPVRSDNNGASHIIFIVRDDAGASDFLFQTADTTWQAYNNYGGINLYRYLNVPPYRAYKVSYNRPFNNRGGTQFAERESFLFNSEYPMIRWMEANGYDVSYASGMDTDRRGSAVLLTHKVFLSVGHDEYWSGQQRANIEAARAGGVHLGFFSGNEMYWKTRWENSIAGTSTANRTLVCYKETRSNAKIDPSPEWTGTWRDPRFSPPSDGGRPENAVMGQFWTVDAFRTDPMMISSSEGKARFWRNTPIAALADGQTAELPAGVLGFEWDEVRDNGFLPPGLFRLSTTTLAVDAYLQDYGSTTAPGIATHSLTLYRHSSGALVFGAGTIQWSWGLDATHDFAGTPVDVRMQQATVNLFADMDTQPTTLQAGLVAATASTDTLAPTSVIQLLPGGTIPAGYPATIMGTATDTGGGLPAGVEFSYDGGTTWHLATGAANWSGTWTPLEPGAVSFKSRAVDDSGRIETPGPGISATIVGGLINGSFESNFTGWTATGNLGIYSQYPSAPDGTKIAAFNGGDLTPNGVLSQTFATIAGQSYTLTFSQGVLANNTNSQTLQVTVTGSGSLLSQSITINGLGGGATRWVPQSFTFVANSASSTLTFQDQSVTTGSLDLLLDKVRVALATQPQVATPTFNPVGGTYATAQSVALSDTTPGAAIYYTTNGSTPTTSSTFYTAPITVASATTIKAMAAMPGWINSAVASATYTIQSLLPAAPNSLTATASGTQVNLVWVDNAVNETGFKIERKTGAGGTYAQIATVGANVTTYSNTGLTAGTTYYYRVRATNGNGDSAYSPEASAATDVVPAAPSGLTATAALSTQVNLTWVDNATNETGFKIELKTGAGGSYAQIATVGSNVTTYSNTGLAAGTTYFYRVRATNGVGDSAYSVETSVITSAPSAPGSLTATVVSGTQINLTWVDNATNETGFKIERKAGAGGTYAQFATTGVNVVTYADTGLTSGTTYFYRVRATNGVGDSAYSPEASATPDVVPVAPVGLAASAVSGTQINLAWVDSSSNETGFKIERKTGAGGSYAQIATVGANVTTYSNTGLTPGTAYFYRVRATNGIGDSAYSPEASATPFSPAFRAATSGAAASGVLSLSIDKPAGTLPGDVMVASIAVRPETATITAPAGWSLVQRMDNTSNTTNSLAVYDKVAGASEPVSYSWTFSASTGAVGGIQSFSGIDTLNPIDRQAGHNTASSLNHATLSVTTQFTYDMLVTSHAFSSSATFTPPAGTPPAGMTEAFDIASATIPSTDGESIQGNYQLWPTANSTGTRTATASNNADRGNAHILALKGSTTTINTAPVADPQSVSVAEDGSLVIALTGSDADTNSLIFAAGSSANGTVTLVGAVATYTPAANFNGPDSFNFTVNDGTVVSAPAVVTITVTSANDAPVNNVPAPQTVIEDTALAIFGVSVNDLDGNLASTRASVSNGELSVSLAGGASITPGANGTSTLTLSGTQSQINAALATMSYQGNLNYAGSDTLTVLSTDANAATDSDTVTLTVTPVNDPPLAIAQAASVAEDGSVEITLIGSDVDGNSLTFLTGGSTHGTVSLAGAVATYTPTANYHGPDSFNFTVNDGIVDSAAAAVTITVTPVNDPPLANAQAVSVAEDGSVEITLAGTDVDGNPLTFVAGSAANGTVSLAGAVATYTPAANYHGPDSFNFTVNDGIVDSTAAAVTITVTPVNDPPLANAQSVSVAEDGALAITLTGSDADGNSLIFAIGSASHGTVSLAGAVATYTPAANYHGPDNFSFTVNDGTEVSAPTAILITVNEVFADDFIDWLAEHHLLATAETDSEHDSIHNVVEYVIGGDPVTGMDASLLPTCSPAVALPGGNPEDANCIRFTYRRTDRAKNNPSATLKVEWASNLMGPWTNSNVTANVVIDVTDDGFDIGVDRVDVYLPMSLAVESKFFVRLGVTITSP